MIIFLIRHGEAIENAKRIILGQSHGTLSQRGVEQARAIAKVFKHHRLHAMYSSDLRRAKDTVHEIHRFHPQLQVIYTRALRERHLGNLQRKFRDSVSFSNLPGGFLSWKPRGGESLKEFRARVQAFLRHLQKRHSGETIVLVTHGGVVRVLYAMIRKVPLSKVFQHMLVGNAAAYRIRVSPRGSMTWVSIRV